jgi:hypothetical protein
LAGEKERRGGEDAGIAERRDRLLDNARSLSGFREEECSCPFPSPSFSDATSLLVFSVAEYTSEEREKSLFEEGT